MAQFASDSFNGTDGTELATYSANWVKHASSGAGTLVIYNSRARKNSGGDEALYYHTGTPASADYSVTSTLQWLSSDGANPAVCGRINTAANTFYMARYDTVAGGWQLYKRVTGTFTQLGSTSSQSFTSGSKEIKLKMVGSAIELFKEGGASATISATDSSITAAGKAGLRAATAATDTTSIHYENFSADDIGGATITGDSGSYTLTGTAATLKVGRKLTADSGTYSLTGTDVAFKRGYALSAESGTYTVSGTAVDLKAGRKLTADSGSYTLTGTDVTLNYSPAGSYNLTAESGTYTLTGTAATLKVSRKLTADSGAYPLTGTDVTLSKGVKLTADSGSYTLSGSNVAFSRTYVLTAESGAYTLTGTSAGLTWSGAPVVEAPTNGGPSIYGKPVFREKQFRKEYEEQVKRIEDEKRLARILREDEEITVIMALMAA